MLGTDRTVAVGEKDAGGQTAGRSSELYPSGRVELQIPGPAVVRNTRCAPATVPCRRSSSPEGLMSSRGGGLVLPCGGGVVGDAAGQASVEYADEAVGELA